MKMKLGLALLLIISPLSVMSGALIEVQCRTKNVGDAEMNGGQISFDICGPNGCCSIDNIDDPNIDNWERGYIDAFTGTELQECNGFDIPDGGLSSFTISHSGDDAWGGDFCRLLLDSMVYYDCKIDDFLDDSSHKTCSFGKL